MDKVRRINTGNKDYKITNKPNKILEAKLKRLKVQEENRKRYDKVSV